MATGKIARKSAKGKAKIKQLNANKSVKARKSAATKHAFAAQNSASFAKTASAGKFAHPASSNAAPSSPISCPAHVSFFSCPTCSLPTLLLYFAGLLILIYGQAMPDGAIYIAVATLLLALSFVGPWLAARLQG